MQDFLDDNVRDRHGAGPRRVAGRVSMAGAERQIRILLDPAACAEHG
jgi:hypothetical protein